MICLLRLFVLLAALTSSASAQVGQIPAWPPLQPPPISILDDGASTPWIEPVLGPNAFYVSGTDTTWYSWEGWQPVNGTPQRVVEVATCTHCGQANETWNGNYIAGTRTLTGDVHGIPVSFPDSNGYVYEIYGAHNSSLHIAVSVSPNDPSLWSDSAALDIVGSYTFPNPVPVGSAIYLFANGPGTGTGVQESISVNKITTSVGVPTVGARVNLFDLASSGADGWAPFGRAVAVGTKIHFVFTYGSTVGADPSSGVYYAIYDTATGNISNYAGTSTIVPASQPINKSTADANFLIYTFTDGGFPALNIDGAGASHVVVADQSSGSPLLIHTTANGGAWSAPHTVYTWPSAVHSVNAVAGPVPNVAGGLDVYFGDGTGGESFPGQGQTSGGNMLRATRSSGGAWGSAQTILAGTSIDNPQPVVNATANARVIFGETSIDQTTISGVLRGWTYGDNGFVTRPSGYGVIPPPTPAAAFLARTSGLDSAHVTAFTNFISCEVTANLWNKWDVIYTPATNSTGNANLNLINPKYTLTPVGSPSFAADKGYTGVDSSTISLDSGYVPLLNGVNFATNSASLFVWTLTSNAPYNGNNVGVYSGVGQNSAYVDFTGATAVQSRLNNNASNLSGTTAADFGFLGSSRLNSTTVSFYYNGSPVVSGGSQGSTALPSNSFHLIGGIEGDGAAAQTGMAGWGAGLTDTDWANHYTCTHAYMHAIAGVP